MSKNKAPTTAENKHSRIVKAIIIIFGIMFGVFTLLLLTPGSWGIQQTIEPFLPHIVGFSPEASSPAILFLCIMMYYWNSCSEKEKDPFGFREDTGTFRVLATWFVLALLFFIIVLGITFLSIHMRRFY